MLRVPTILHRKGLALEVVGRHFRSLKNISHMISLYSMRRSRCFEKHMVCSTYHILLSCVLVIILEIDGDAFYLGDSDRYHVGSG